MKTAWDLDRRQFLKTGTAVGAGLMIGFYVEPKIHRALAQEGGPPQAKPLPPPNAFVRIAPDDSVTVLLAHAEMGQGIWTTLAMMVAEELDCDWSKIKVEHAPAGAVYAHTAFGIQMTGGSTSTWSEMDRYRQVGAMAREMLIQAAAQEWKVDAGSLKAADGAVHNGEKKLSYGQLAAAAEKLTPPKEVKLKEAKDWKHIGKPHKRLDSPEKVNGSGKFGMDVQFPGLMTALVARSPVFGGKVKSVKDAAAKAVPGVKNVVQVPSGVAVIAEHFWAAKVGREALEIEWDLGEGAKVDTEALKAEYRELAKKPGLKPEEAGNAVSAMEKAASQHEAYYEVPFLAHAPMEPLNCTIKADANGAEIWTGTQFPMGEQMAAAQILGLKPEQVKVNTPFLGGGFGRRATPTADFVSEAAHVAKAAGVPVKVVWTREDDLHGGYYRPMATHRVKAGLDAEGKPVAWHQTIVCQSILAGTPFEAMMVKNGIDETCVEGASDSPYVKPVPDRLVELHSPRLVVPTLWWRSVGHTHTAFAMESFIDELAHAAKQDPLEYRRKRLEGNARHLGVLNLAAEKANWGKPLPAGHFHGIAVHSSFGSLVAQVAEVSVEGKRIQVHKVVCAVDCGVVVNPAGVEAQMESGIVYGLSAALLSELHIKEGRVQETNFHDYKVARLAGTPLIEVHIVQNSERSGGAGEPGTPPIAPAVANAVFAATGQRLRQMPFRLS